MVSSLIFCSVTDHAARWTEIARVAATGRRTHSRHDAAGHAVAGDFFSAVTPWWSQVACNCHLDRPTIDVLQAAGWTVQVRRQRHVRAHGMPATAGRSKPELQRRPSSDQHPTDLYTLVRQRTKGLIILSVVLSTVQRTRKEIYPCSKHVISKVATPCPPRVSAHCDGPCGVHDPTSSASRRKPCSP